jgi:hypothetical protein
VTTSFEGCSQFRPTMEAFPAKRDGAIPSEPNRRASLLRRGYFRTCLQRKRAPHGQASTKVGCSGMAGHARKVPRAPYVHCRRDVESTSQPAKSWPEETVHWLAKSFYLTRIVNPCAFHLILPALYTIPVKSTHFRPDRPCLAHSSLRAAL